MACAMRSATASRASGSFSTAASASFVGVDDLHLAAEAVIDDAGGGREGAARAVNAGQHRVHNRHDGYDSCHGQQDGGNGLLYGGTPS